MRTLLAVAFFAGMVPSVSANRDAPPSPSPTGDRSRPAAADSDVPADYDKAPVPIRITQPIYPPAAYADHISGTVELEIVIDDTGRVSKYRIVRSVPELDQAAIACVREWKFRPARKAGQPVASVASAPITFSLTRPKKTKEKKEKK